MKTFKLIAIISLLTINGFLIMILGIAPLRSQIQEIAGFAVAASSTRWNNVKDAVVGDAQINGLMATGPYIYDASGASWNRLRGDTGGNLMTTTAVSTTIATNQVTVADTATAIKALNTSRRSITIRNQGTTDMFIGSASVTTSTGFSVRAGESISLDRNTAAIYGIVASGSTTVGYLEE